MTAPNVAVVDLGQGNVGAVVSALTFLGVSSSKIQAPDLLTGYSHVILPGVGSFGSVAMNLWGSGFAEALLTCKEIGTPILGICLGYHLLGLGSEESSTENGLGFFPTRAELLKVQPSESPTSSRVPHMGYNSVHLVGESKLFQNIASGSDFYFTHSYAFNGPIGLAETHPHGLTRFSNTDFLSFRELDGVFGVQFHPERSQGNGLALLKNFSNIC